MTSSLDFAKRVARLRRLALVSFFGSFFASFGFLVFRFVSCTSC